MIKVFRQIIESFLFAINALVINKLRTFLSLLGITIGIFAIIAVFTVLDSLENNIRTSIESLGDDVVYIQKWPWTFSPDYPWWKYMRRPVPNYREFLEIQANTEKSETVAFIASTSGDIQYMKNSCNSGIMMASHDYDKIWSFEISQGRYFSQFESSNGRNAIILGSDVAQELFGAIDPIGKDVKLKGRKLKVIGVFKREGNTIGESLDGNALMPLNYGRNIYNIKSERLNPFIMAKSKDGVHINELMDELRGNMRAIRRLKPIAEDNFALNRASLIINQFDKIFSSIGLTGGIIGGFSILVGAFGIANIMFVSVKERTHIIGIQKSLGSKNYFILSQFLFESVILSLFGGLIGLVLVFIGTQINFEDLPIGLELTFSNIMVGINISVIVGLVSGIVPAYIASKLNPVEAINTKI